MTTPHDVIAAAIKSIEKRGWTQGKVFDDHDGSACALGHIQLALIDLHATGEEKHDLDWKAQTLLIRGIRQVAASCDPYSGGIPGFNDANGRSQEEVTLAFKYALEQPE